MKIAILSTHSGKAQRGVENWAAELKSKLRFDINVVSGNYIKKYYEWSNVDIVVSTNGRFQVLFARIVSFVKNKPLVVFGHSGPGADDKWNLICSPNVFVSFSLAQKKWVDKYKMPWTKSIVISHAVDTVKFRPAKSKPKNNLVLCVAANTKDKRISLVKKAVSNLKNTEFLVVGKGNKIQVDFKEMPSIYKRASLFCFVPQPWEAFGLVYLEAMASNLPIVTIDDLTRQEIVGDAGILVQNPENITKLSEAIKKVLKTNWGNKPRQQAEKFSWDKITKKYNNLFENLV